jgi:hypothetical protein
MDQLIHAYRVQVKVCLGEHLSGLSRDSRIDPSRIVVLKNRPRGSAFRSSLNLDDVLIAAIARIRRKVRVKFGRGSASTGDRVLISVDKNKSTYISRLRIGYGKVNSRIETRSVSGNVHCASINGLFGGREVVEPIAGNVFAAPRPIGLPGGVNRK